MGLRFSVPNRATPAPPPALENHQTHTNTTRTKRCFAEELPNPIRLGSGYNPLTGGIWVDRL